MSRSLLKVKVIPKASQNQLVGWEGDRLKVRLRALPEKGAANKELIAFVAKQLKVAKSLIRISSGSTSRLKTLEVSNMPQEMLDETLRNLLL